MVMIGNDQPRIVRLTASDGEQCEVEVDAIRCSSTISDMIDSIGENELVESLPVPSTPGSTLKLIIEWATHHKNDSSLQPENGNDDPQEKKEFSDWDLEFIDLDKNVLIQLVVSLNHLNIPALNKLACFGIANLIRGKTPEQIRATFHIRNERLIADQDYVDAVARM